jgi:trk system potassium uptake protein TrkH
VIRLGALLYIIGQFLTVLAGTMLVPLLYGLWTGNAPRPFAIAIVITGVVGIILFKTTRRPKSELSHREGVLLIVAVWILSSLFGCLPFYLSPYFKSFTDAFFEMTSGFTTTGATILADVEILPHHIQLWRCLSHWLGGMGVVLLGIAVLPLVGIGGMPLYRAEFPGAKSEKLKSRIAETALALWKTYFGLTLAAYISLRWAGMNPFDSICHAFSTVATGGFSTRTASIAAFHSFAIEFILIIFMLLAGMSFVLHYVLWMEQRPKRVFADVELRFYLMVFTIATAAIYLSLVAQTGYNTTAALRSSLFQAGSIITGTGFISDNYEKWSSFSHLILLALVFVGGCTGSTTGGLKSSRVLLLLKVVGRQFKRLVERRGVFTIRLGSRAFPENTIESLLSFVYLAFLVNFISCLLLSISGVDVFSSIAAVAACMFNVGPGFGTVGPNGHYGHLPTLAKWVLSMCMLAGRLEFYTVLAIFAPAFWRR